MRYYILMRFNRIIYGVTTDKELAERWSRYKSEWFYEEHGPIKHLLVIYWRNITFWAGIKWGDLTIPIRIWFIYEAPQVISSYRWKAE